MREQQKYLDENIQASLDEAINIMEQSLNAVRMKMYGDFGDHSAVSTTALKVKFTKTWQVTWRLTKSQSNFLQKEINYK